MKINLQRAKKGSLRRCIFWGFAIMLSAILWLEILPVNAYAQNSRPRIIAAGLSEDQTITDAEVKDIAVNLLILDPNRIVSVLINGEEQQIDKTTVVNLQTILALPENGLVIKVKATNGIGKSTTQQFVIRRSKEEEVTSTLPLFLQLVRTPPTWTMLLAPVGITAYLSFNDTRKKEEGEISQIRDDSGSVSCLSGYSYHEGSECRANRQNESLAVVLGVYGLYSTFVYFSRPKINYEEENPEEIGFLQAPSQGFNLNLEGPNPQIGWNWRF